MAFILPFNSHNSTDCNFIFYSFNVNVQGIVCCNIHV